MSAILKFLFPGEPRDSRSSWLLLAARIVFGLLLMSHGIAKLQNFEALSATFPDPLGVGGRVSLMLAVFGEVVCSAGCVVGLFYRLALIPMAFTMCVAFFAVHGGDTFAGVGAGLPGGFRPDVRGRPRPLCRRYAYRAADPGTEALAPVFSFILLRVGRITGSPRIWVALVCRPVCLCIKTMKADAFYHLPSLFCGHRPFSPCEPG